MTQMHCQNPLNCMPKKMAFLYKNVNIYAYEEILGLELCKPHFSLSGGSLPIGGPQRRQEGMKKKLAPSYFDFCLCQHHPQFLYSAREVGSCLQFCVLSYTPRTVLLHPFNVCCFNTSIRWPSFSMVWEFFFKFLDSNSLTTSPHFPSPVDGSCFLWFLSLHYFLFSFAFSVLYCLLSQCLRVYFLLKSLTWFLFYGLEIDW